MNPTLEWVIVVVPFTLFLYGAHWALRRARGDRRFGASRFMDAVLLAIFIYVGVVSALTAVVFTLDVFQAVPFHTYGDVEDGNHIH